MEKDISILTDEQQRAYLLRQKKFSFRRIGEELGISESDAQKAVRSAERRFREHEHYLKQLERENALIDFPLTRGELKEIVIGLGMLERDMTFQSTSNRAVMDWRGRTSTRFQRIRDLIVRAETALSTLPNENVEKTDTVENKK